MGQSLHEGGGPVDSLPGCDVTICMARHHAAESDGWLSPGLRPEQFSADSVAVCRVGGSQYAKRIQHVYSLVSGIPTSLQIADYRDLTENMLVAQRDVAVCLRKMFLDEREVHLWNLRFFGPRQH
jgi:hypothetical protein